LSNFYYIWIKNDIKINNILEKEQAIQDKKEYFDFMKKNKKKLNKANAKGEVIEIENGKIKKYQI